MERQKTESLSRGELFTIALLALLLHLVVALVVPLPGTFGKYSGAARLLAEGQLAPERRIDFSPLYLELYRLALPLESVFGPAERYFPWLQIGLLAWAIAAFAAAASRHLGRRGAFVFALLLACDRHLFTYVRMLEPEMVLLALLATWIFLLERDDPGRRELLLAGVAAALAVATRPTFLPVFLVMVPLYFGFRNGFRPGSAWRRRSLLFLLPVLLGGLLLAWRSWLITGDPRTPAMNPGTVFFEGHQPLSSGTSARYPPAVHLALRADPGREPDIAHSLYRNIAREESGDPALSIRAVNDFWASRAWAFLMDQPGWALWQSLQQLLYSLNGYSFHDVPQAVLLEQRLGIFFVPYALLAAFAFFGVLVELGQLRERFLFYAVLAAQLGVMTLFYVSARQRLVLLPAVVFFALLGFRRLRKGGGCGLLMGLLLSLLALSLSLRDDVQNEDRFLHEQYSASLALRDELQAKLAGGVAVARLAEPICTALAEMPSRLEDLRLAGYPQDAQTLEQCVAGRVRERLETIRDWAKPTLEFDLAQLEILNGRLDEAETLIEDLTLDGYRFPREGAGPSLPQYFQARIDFLRGDPSLAYARLDQALAAAPGEPFVLADLYAITGKASHRRQLERYYSRLDADWLCGRALVFYGKSPEAIPLLGEVVQRLPKARRARLELAIALAGAGRDAEAIGQLLLAYQGPSEPTAQASRVLPLLERQAQRWQNLEVQQRIDLGVLFFHHGAYTRARELLGPALQELSPDQRPPQLVELLAQLSAASTGP